MLPGLPARQTHGYLRHGTTTLFAALEVATGKVTNACYPRHRHQEFLRFIQQVAKAYPHQNLHVVCDNYRTHTHAKVVPGSSAIPNHVALHPYQWLLAQHGRDLFRDHHTSGHPPPQLHQRQTRLRPN
jgi:DDE superfamily endonuclease